MEYGMYDEYILALSELKEVLEIDWCDWMLTDEDYNEMYCLASRLRTLLLLNNY